MKIKPRFALPPSKHLVGIISLTLLLLFGLVAIVLNFSDVSAAGLLASSVSGSAAIAEPINAGALPVTTQSEIADARAAEIDALVKQRSLSTDDPQINRQLAQLYYEQGLEWRDANRLEVARQAFGWALSVDPDFADAKAEERLVELYITGTNDYQQAAWAQAISSFEPVYQQQPTYLHVDEILYSAYYNLGLVQETDGDLQQALATYRQAVSIVPGAPEAAAKIEEVDLKLYPPTPEPPAPTPTPVIEKRVVVDVSDQRTYLYENDELTTEFIVSTGEVGRDTAIGEFEIQSKIPMAYASTWNLDMPFWLGIYYSGPLENGFHAVPTVRDTGITMWDGYLGQRVSYGCVILSMEDAETLYNWVEMGTPVSIVP